MDSAFHKLSFKTKRLYEFIANSSYGRYHDQLTESQKNLVSTLLELGLVETFSASWSGERVYRASPQSVQRSGISS